MNYNKLKTIIKEKKFTIDEISLKIEMTREGLTRSLNEEKLKIDTLEKICEIINSSPSDFFDGNGKYKYLVKNKVPEKLETFILPMFGDAQAGYIVGYSQEEKEIYYESHQLPSHLGQNARGFIVHGESMLPLLNKDDVIFCKRVLDFSIHRFFEDDIYVMILEGGIMVKHVRYDKDSDSVVLISANRDFKNIIVPTREVLEVWRAEYRMLKM